MAKPENISIPAHEYELSFQASSGPGGQHVNKVATAVRLSFDIDASESLNAYQKHRVKAYADRRITREGLILIKVDSNRSQLKNRAEAVRRLEDLIRIATKKEKKRIPTKMPKAVKRKIKEGKKRRSKLKEMRKKVDY
ncbi:MAG: alternative ribosome rescue aminoacyl-tRNA hydrolase ArfB [Bacteroidota bacterium]